jgi:hypothetical protein
MDRNIARAVTDKKPVPEIDFTLHVMEDGTQVSTLERVVKGATPYTLILLGLILINCPQRCKRLP